MTREEYEAIKAQVLAEQKAERKARAEERKRIKSEAAAMFDETKKEYLPKLVMKYGQRTGDYDCAIQCSSKIYDLSKSALNIIGERNAITAHMNGRAAEANTVLRQLLDSLLA